MTPMMGPLHVAFLAGTLLIVPDAARADSVPHVQSIRFACGDGRCFHNGALDRLDAVKRDGPRDGETMRPDDDDAD